jgi:nucleotide-binding universal stress UspA family protein
MPRLEPPDSSGIDLPAPQDWGKHGPEESFHGGRTPEDLANPCGTDFSPQASSALEWARRLAGAFGAELVLLHVINIFGLAELSCVTGGPDPLLLFREQAHKSMEELKARKPDAQAVVHEGSPSHLIVGTALDLNCQMIVMGTPRSLGTGAFAVG